ncbi:MAG: metallophosphoesterase family protein [Phenylobacterium sp.]|uniref:metallophosphoesterase family protein n=1 Tax=Phenylobacterium sp. TaxID=1871053 RepID=UPI0027187176|nr:metallophosphoesterase family protein [Phenylobacterium sp.]MDO8911575.1 metallophosphoesterase family protein [Phenylobacterium sp.]MDP3099383.1 metallophosphoesterase family protein [Phenylobacterium sp.]
MLDSVWRLPFEGTNIAVLADCHIHDGGPQFPSALFPRLQGADLIVTLGDMGQRSGLDQLQEIAPVLGVRGADDDDDIRTRRHVLVLEGDGYRLGCVFDAKAAGLAEEVDPFIAADRAHEVCQRLFGGPLNILLHAGTHRADEAWFGQGGSALNPGSAVLPAEGARPSLLRLKVSREGSHGQVIWVA